MEPWRYFWKLVLYILLVSEHTGSQVTFTSPEVPGGTQDLTDSSPLESESNTSLEPEARLPSGWISLMATTELVSEVSTSAAIMADTYEILSGQLHSLPLESSTPNAENPSPETTFFQATNAPDDISRTTDSLSFAEASIAPPGATSIAPSPPPTQGYTRSIHSRSIPTRKHSSGFRPPGTSMVKKGSTSAYLLSPQVQDPTGRMSHLAIMKLVSEVSTSAAMLDDSYEMLSGQLHSLPLESSTPNAESPSQETTFFQATSTPAGKSRSTDSLSFAEASIAPPGATSIAPSPPPTQGYARSIHSRSIPTRKHSSGFRLPGTSMVKKGSTNAYLLSPQDPTGWMSHPATMKLVSEVSTSAAIMADTYEMLSGQLHSLSLESSTLNGENPSPETTFFQATNAPDDKSRTTDSLSFAEASSAQPWSAFTALSPPPTQGYAHSIPARKSSAGFRPPGTSMVKEEPTSSPQGSIGQMSNMATTELVSTSATMLAEAYEMLSSHLHSLPLESSTPNAESPSQETTFFQATSE